MNRLRAARDEGEALIFVMLISAMVLIMLAAASTALLDQIRPTGNSIAAGQAYAAAEAGIEDFTAQVNTRCSDTASFSCPWVTNGLTSNPSVGDPQTQQGIPVHGADGSAGTEAFDWTVRFAATGFVRLVSVGQALDGAGKPTITKTLVADLGATPSFNDFEYYTKYETFPADFVNGFYAARNVNITNASGSSLSGAGLLRWNGTCTYVSATATPTCDPNHDTSICNDLYYPSDAGPGRGTDTAWNNAVRRPTTAVQSAMGTDSSFAYYSEQGLFTPTVGLPAPVTHNDVCDSSFEPNMVMNGPIYSQDAYLIDRGKDTGNSANSMPVFNDHAFSMWNGVINAIQQPKGANEGYDRPYPNTNGQISTSLRPEPVYTTDKLDLPPNADGAKALATCTYTGPTRILIKQNTAYVTSPGTPTSPAPPGPTYCYAGTGAFADTAGGVTNAQVPINSTLIYVANPAASGHPLATASSPIFNLTTTTPVPAPLPTLSLVNTFTNNAYSAGTKCTANLSPTTSRQDFDCEASAAPTGSAPPDVYGNIMANITSTLQASTGDAAALQAALTATVNAQFNPAVLVPNATKPYYQVSVSLPAVTKSTSPPAPDLAPPDAFYQSSTSGGFTTNTLSTSLSISRCTSLGCKKPATIVSGSVSVAVSTGTPLVAKKSWPWFGAQTGANTYTDPSNDITPYYKGYGDAYVEGTLKGSMSIVAEHDIVITNDLTYANSNLNTTSDGLALVADHNVRIYRPMTCTDNDPSNSTGFLDSHGAVQPRVGMCPNDLTGVFTTPLSWPLPNNYPSTKYVADNAPSMTSTGQGVVYATIFTLRGCFMVDNFYRGALGYSADVYGGLYQYHRGPTSLPYQGRPYQGSKTKMPGMVVSYTYDNMRAGQTANGGLRVPWIPNPVGRPAGSTRTWNVVDISTGT